MNDILIQYNQLAPVFDYLSVGIILISPEHKIVSVNKSAQLLTGYTEPELVGRPCRDVFLGGLCGGDCKFEKTIATGRSSLTIDSRLLDKNSESHSVTKIISPLYGIDGEIAGCIEIIQDHSAFKDLVRRVRYDDRRLKLILDNLDIGVLTVDRGGHITFFNTVAETITGYPREKVLGKACGIIFGGQATEEIALLSSTIADGAPRANKEGELITRGGQRIPIRANYMALKNEAGHVLGGLATLSDLSLVHQLSSAVKDRYTFYDMVGRSPAMQSIFETVPVVAASNATILIEGPTGTGKDLLTKVIHSAGKRADNPLVKVNCAALPDNLLESEMFGYAKGAFTGADRDKPGRFHEADGGTLFLDEIGDLPLALQAKLLRVLEDQEFYPLGSRKISKVDVRIISATNQDLERMVAAKQFREDLFYRLNVMRFEIPPLKDRPSDIPLLISHILKRLCATNDTRVEKISESAMETLLNYDYPGNIRELENILEHAVIICQEKTIARKHLPLFLQKRTLPREPVDDVGETPMGLDKEIELSEKNMILAVLKQHNWHRGRTAKALNIDRTTLWRKIKKYRFAEGA